MLDRHPSPDRRPCGARRTALPRFLALLAACALAALASGCKAPRQKTPSHLPAKRTRLLEGYHVVRQLAEESTRAEVLSMGLLVHFDGADQHKYDLGGFGTGPTWRKRDGKIVYTEIGAAARLAFHDFQGGLRSVLVRARSAVKGQRLSLLIDSVALDPIEIGEAWKTYELQLPAPLGPGRRLVTLQLKKEPAEEGRHRADVEWIWFRTKDVGPGPIPPEPQLVKVLSFGSPLRSLVADAPRSLAFYLQVPEGGALIFDYAARRPTRFEVSVRTDTSLPRTVFSAEAGGLYRAVRVSLAEFAGRLVRLELATKGPGGPAAWGEPLLVATGALPKVPAILPANRAKHLVQIIVDSARQDATRPFNPRSSVESPGLEALAKRGVAFTRAYANAVATLPSVASAMSGSYPSTFIENPETARVPKELPLLAEHLKRQGFSTAAFTASLYFAEPFGLTRGFDTVRNFRREKLSTDAETVFAEAAKWLKGEAAKGKRVYLAVHTTDLRDPYRVRAPFTEKLYGGAYKGTLGQRFVVATAKHKPGEKSPYSEDDQKWIRALYLGGVAYHDAQLARFLDELKKAGVLDDALVVYSGDHGEELFDHGGLGHGHSLYDEVVRSPLVLSYPRVLPLGATVKETVELVDLLPTAVELLGVPPLAGVHGTSLLGAVFAKPSPTSSVVLVEAADRALLVGAIKLIQSPTLRAELYDLTRDPGEKKSLSETHPVSRRTCEILLGEAIAIHAKGARITGQGGGPVYSKQSVVLDEELEKQLKALGYIH
jgi:choline-sulfatase